MADVDALRIDGDDLSFDLLPMIERSFDVRLDNRALTKVVTVGQLHALVQSTISCRGGHGCSSAISFYAIRRALMATGGSARLRPGDPLNGLGQSPKALRAYLERQTGLAMPSSYLGHAGAVGCLACLLLGGAGAALVGGWVATGAVLLAVAALKLDRGSWAGEWRTAGDLARAVAVRNHAALAKRGGRHDPEALWRCLTEMVAAVSVDRSAGSITADTRLMT